MRQYCVRATYNNPKKWFVVFRGHKPGVYHTYKNAKEHFVGYERRLVKTYWSYKQAKRAFDLYIKENDVESEIKATYQWSFTPPRS